MTEQIKESMAYQAIRDKAIAQLRSGQSLTGEGGVFAPLLKEFLESALEAEMEAHLDSEQRELGNKRNGKGSKILKTTSGNIQISTPQDRQSSFNPQIVKKRETVLAENFEPKILGLYGLGMSLRDISSHLEELYDVNISASVLSEITDKIIPKVKDWQSRCLDSVYPIVWLDAMHYKVRDGGLVVSKAVYNILALDKEGRKQLIGMYVSESEGANFWLTVLTDLKSRGVEDILIACVDRSYIKYFS